MLKGGIHCDSGDRLWAASHFHSLLEIYELKYRQQMQILLTSDLALHEISLDEKRMTFRNPLIGC